MTAAGSHVDFPGFFSPYLVLKFNGCTAKFLHPAGQDQNLIVHGRSFKIYRNRKHRHPDAGLLHIIVGIPFITEQLCPRRFQISDIIGVVHDAHLVCFIILHSYFRFKSFHW